MSRPPFDDRLRDELVAAARRSAWRAPARRRSPVLLAAAAVLLAAMLTTLLLIRSGDSASAGIDVTVDHGIVNVRLRDLEHRPGVIEDAIRRAGIHADVVGVPVGPSLVGKFVASGGNRPAPELKTRFGTPRAFEGFAIPATWDGTLELAVGRPAKQGEQYMVPSDARSQGEPLACRTVVGTGGRQAAAVLRTLPVTPRWEAYDGVAGSIPRPIDAADLGRAPYRSWKVAQVVAFSKTDVLVQLTPDGTGRLDATIPYVPPTC